jgi:hypothetical protein
LDPLDKLTERSVGEDIFSLPLLGLTENKIIGAEFTA